MRHRNLPAAQAVLVVVIALSLNAVVMGAPDARQQTASMTLPEAISRALASNPGLKAARIDIEVAQARRDGLALDTPYKLEAEIENFAGTDTLSGFDSSETTLQVSRTLELGRKRQHRANLGDAKLGLAHFESAIGELGLAAEVSRRYAALLKQQELIKLAAESVDISSRTLAIVARRVAAGRASEAEESSAEVALLQSELIGNRLGFEMRGARVDLATLWGSTEPTFGSVVGDIYAVPRVPAYADLQTRLAENPDVLKIATEASIRDAERRLAQSKQRPDIELSAGVRYLAVPNDMAMVFAVSVPFGTKGRAEPFIREADTQIARMPLSRDQRLLELQATLYKFYQLLLASRDELATLRDQIIPAAERAVQFYERGFEVGSYSLLELTAARERLLAMRGDALNAAAAVHLTLIEIESLLGNARPGAALL